MFTGFVGCGDGGEPHVDKHGFTGAWRAGEKEALSIELVSARNNVLILIARRERVRGEDGAHLWRIQLCQLLHVALHSRQCSRLDFRLLLPAV